MTFLSKCRGIKKPPALAGGMTFSFVSERSRTLYRHCLQCVRAEPDTAAVEDLSSPDTAAVEALPPLLLGETDDAEGIRTGGELHF